MLQCVTLLDEDSSKFVYRRRTDRAYTREDAKQSHHSSRSSNGARLEITPSDRQPRQDCATADGTWRRRRTLVYAIPRKRESPASWQRLGEIVNPAIIRVSPREAANWSTSAGIEVTWCEDHVGKIARRNVTPMRNYPSRWRFGAEIPVTKYLRFASALEIVANAQLAGSRKRRNILSDCVTAVFRAVHSSALAVARVRLSSLRSESAKGGSRNSLLRPPWRHKGLLSRSIVTYHLQGFLGPQEIEHGLQVLLDIASCRRHSPRRASPFIRR